MKNLNPSQMFWKPSKDDLSNRNVRELPAKKIKENCHSQMVTSTTRGKQLERNNFTFLPPVKKLNSRYFVKYLWHKHEQKYWILKKAEHQWPRSKYKSSKFFQEKLNFLQILSPWKKQKFGKDTNEQKKTQPSEILSPDYNTEFWKFTLSFAL